MFQCERSGSYKVDDDGDEEPGTEKDDDQPTLYEGPSREHGARGLH